MMESANLPERSFADQNKELATAFERYMVSRGWSPQTRRAYRDTVGRLLKMLNSRNVLEVSRAHIRELQSQLIDRGLSPNSLLIHSAAIRSFFKFLRVAGLVPLDPTLRLGTRKALPMRRPRLLTVDEIERLIAASETPFERAIVEVLYATAVRVSELVAVQLQDVDFASLTMRVEKGKGGKSRIIPFGDHAGAALCIYLAERAEGFLFEHDGKPYSTTRIRQVLYMLAKRANVPDVHPHAFRRACATHMLASSASIRAVQDLLGHEHITTTQIYTSLTTTDLQRVYERCHPHSKGENR